MEIREKRGIWGVLVPVVPDLLNALNGEGVYLHLRTAAALYGIAPAIAFGCRER